MEVADLINLRKRVQHAKPKMTSEMLFGKTLHSEVNHLTVTRIAGSQAEYHKKVKTYRKDMAFTIKNINRKQYQLRCTMVHYSRKLRHSKKERELRLQEMQKPKSVENSPLLIPIQEEKDAVINNIRTSGEDEEEIEETVEHDEICNETNDEANKRDLSPGLEYSNVKNAEVKHETPQTLSPIPELNEPREATPHLSENSYPVQDCPMATLTKHLEFGVESTLTMRSERPSVNDFDVKFYSQKNKKKKEKRAVSYSDLVKLHHSSNTKKLFHLVDKLSKIHTGSDNKKTVMADLEQIRGNSLFYTINYGYDVPNEEPAQETVYINMSQNTTTEPVRDEGAKMDSNDETILPYNRLFSEADNKFWRDIHRARLTPEIKVTTSTDYSYRESESKTVRRRRRASDLHLLVEDYSAMKNKAFDKNDGTQHGVHNVYSSASSHPKHLPPLSKKSKAKNV